MTAPSRRAHIAAETLGLTMLSAGCWLLHPGLALVVVGSLLIAASLIGGRRR